MRVSPVPSRPDVCGPRRRPAAAGSGGGAGGGPRHAAGASRRWIRRSASTLGGIGSANATGLVSPFAGVAGLPTTGIRGPALLFQPTASAGLLLTDNVRQTPTHRAADADFSSLRASRSWPICRGCKGRSPSAAQSINMWSPPIWTRSMAPCLGRCGHDRAEFRIRRREKLAERRLPPTARSAFTNVSQLPQSQLTQVFTNTVSPYYRKSFGDIANAELRYRFSSTNFFGTQTSGLDPS